jgi:hypothetical protein
MPPRDDVFGAFLTEMPRQLCVECLTAIYGTTNNEETATHLRDLGAAVETTDAACGNCERHTRTYGMRRAR